MSLTSDQISAYLARIRYSGSGDLTLATLQELHQAHLLTVPFENLDNFCQRPIRLDPSALFAKIVTAGRGGLCYELNSLFGWLLAGLGFRIQFLSGQVSRPDGSFGPEFDHLLLRVDLTDPWLADVGYGDSFRAPLRLTTGVISDGNQAEYQLISQADRWYLQQQKGSEWKSLFRFRLAPHQLSEFAEMCEFHQTSPDSLFTRIPLCTLATPSGRVTLSKRRLIITESDQKQERSLNSDPDYHAALWEYFGIRL